MRKNEASYQAARRYQADHPGTSYTRAKRITAAHGASMIALNPNALRLGSDRLKTLAAQLRSDPGNHDSVVTEVVEQLRELARGGAGKTHEALAARADTFEAGSEVTAESIEQLARILKAAADDVSTHVERAEMMAEKWAAEQAAKWDPFLDWLRQLAEGQITQSA